jgi:sterol desaturase/sphingolipid hydroxylase (fatty acid hydroxylase superfamily)
MLVPVLVLAAALAMMSVERLRPGRLWAAVPGWWRRVLLLNAVQALVVVAAGLTWGRWLPDWRPWDAEALLGVPGAAAMGYLVITFVYYWWHRARHENPMLWRLLHQIHHSPTRIEVATSFYKHPYEIAANSVLSSVIFFLVCGLGPASAALTVLVCGLAELFYHWNVKTPYWVGFLIQRPESHCVHHERGAHAGNYSDLPLWDMLFGTFHNPKPETAFECGFANAGEQSFGLMILGVDVAVHEEAWSGWRWPA